MEEKHDAGRPGTVDGMRPHSGGKWKDLAFSLQGCAFLSKAGYRTQEEKKMKTSHGEGQLNPSQNKRWQMVA